MSAAFAPLSLRHQRILNPDQLKSAYLRTVRSLSTSGPSTANCWSTTSSLAARMNKSNFNTN